MCGLFGIKPTRGRVSHGPIVPDLAGLATNGPIARSVRDAALMLDLIAGNRPGDMYHAAPQEGTFLEAADRAPGRLRIGRSMASAVPGAEIHPDCVAAYDATTELLTELGHEVEDLDMPWGADLVPHFETLWAAMATLTPVPPDREERLRPLTRHLRERGNAITAPELFMAQGALQLAVRLAMPVAEQYDVILHPTLAQPPVPIGYFDDVDPAENFERQKRFTPFTSIYNITGQLYRQRPAALERRRPADRRDARRPDERRGHPHLAVRPTRGRPPLGRPASADVGLTAGSRRFLGASWRP